MNRQVAIKTVGIVGGGLAGLSAACALADQAYKVTLLERRPYLGGRASSYQHPGTGEIVDNCQHVLLGCCTNLLDFYRRLGVEEKIGWYDSLNFIEPGGRVSVIRPSFLPAPLHGLLSFARAKFLEVADKDAIARGLLRMIDRELPESDEHFLGWLERHGQTSAAIERFWKPVLVSALNEDLDRISLRYASQVFRESFLKSPPAGRIGIPRVPLSQLYGAAGDYLRERHGDVLLRCGTESVQSSKAEVTLRASGQELRFDAVILALPFEALAEILPSSPETEALRTDLEKFEHSPITGIHLWFDREITGLPHAVLLDRTIQWMFNKSVLQNRGSADSASYLELVVSSSKTLVEKGRQEIIQLALAELAEFFLSARQAQLLKATVIKEVHATYSAQPGMDRYRPGNVSPLPRLFLAGDWTATGWPATMEGAVRSGYAAAEALTQAAAAPRKFLMPDLPARGLMKLFG
jgi:zeta-carotene desaturase